MYCDVCFGVHVLLNFNGYRVTAKHICLDRNHHNGIRDVLSMQLFAMNQREMGHVVSHVRHKTDYLFSVLVRN
jgi:hypothetical protein